MVFQRISIISHICNLDVKDVAIEVHKIMILSEKMFHILTGFMFHRSILKFISFSYRHNESFKNIS